MDIEKLKAQIQHFRDGSFDAAARVESICASLDRLQRELEEARKGADRYEHLRSRAQFLDRNGPGLYWYLPRFLKGDAGEQLDQSIDAARKQLEDKTIVFDNPSYPGWLAKQKI